MSPPKLPLFETLDQIGFSIFVKNGDGRYLFGNGRTSDELGISNSDLLRENDRIFFERSSALQMIERDKQIFRSMSPRLYTSVVRKKEIWQRFETLKVPTTDLSDFGNCIIGVSITIVKRPSIEVSALLDYLYNLTVINQSRFKSSFLRWIESVK